VGFGEQGAGDKERYNLCTLSRVRIDCTIGTVKTLEYLVHVNITRPCSPNFHTDCKRIVNGERLTHLLQLLSQRLLVILQGLQLVLHLVLPTPLLLAKVLREFVDLCGHVQARPLPDILQPTLEVLVLLFAAGAHGTWGGPGAA